MLKYGHTPVAPRRRGTVMIGDPGRTDLRCMMDVEEIGMRNGKKSKDLFEFASYHPITSGSTLVTVRCNETGAPEQRA